MQHLVRLPFDFQPEAAVSGPLLVQVDRAAYLSFNTMVERDGQLAEAGKTLLAFEPCWIAQFGYPNDEARARGGERFAPDIRNHVGICEQLESEWLNELKVVNERAFPGASWFLASARHFVIPFHESTFHCISAGIAVVLRDATFEEVWTRIREAMN